MRDFIYEIPVKVYFGREQFGHLGQELSRHGKKYCSYMEEVLSRGRGCMTRLFLRSRRPI